MAAANDISFHKHRVWLITLALSRVRVQPTRQRVGVVLPRPAARGPGEARIKHRSAAGRWKAACEKKETIGRHLRSSRHHRPRRESIQAQPLVEGERRHTRVRAEAEVPAQPTNLSVRERDPKIPTESVATSPKSGLHEVSVSAALGIRDQRRISPGHPQSDTVRRRRRVEIEATQPPYDLHVPPRLEQERPAGLVRHGSARESPRGCTIPTASRTYP